MHVFETPSLSQDVIDFKPKLATLEVPSIASAQMQRWGFSYPIASYDVEYIREVKNMRMHGNADELSYSHAHQLDENIKVFCIICRCLAMQYLQQRLL